MSISISINSMRIAGPDKNYYLAQLEEFASHFDEAKYNSICFGKQDIRGALSITFFDHRHCVPMQRHFDNKEALLGFVVGYNIAKRDVDYI